MCTRTHDLQPLEAEARRRCSQSDLGRGSSLHLHDQQRLVGAVLNHLAGLLQDSLLDVGLVGAIQVIHDLLQALERLPHLVLLPLADHCCAD